jgi:hypothetical protein
VTRKTEGYTCSDYETAAPAPAAAANIGQVTQPLEQQQQQKKHQQKKQNVATPECPAAAAPLDMQSSGGCSPAHQCIIARTATHVSPALHTSAPANTSGYQIDPSTP